MVELVRLLCATLEPCIATMSHVFGSRPLLHQTYDTKLDKCPDTAGHFYVTHLRERCCFGNEAVESGGEEFRVGNDALADVTVQADGDVTVLVLSRHNFNNARMVEAASVFPAALAFPMWFELTSYGREALALRDQLISWVVGQAHEYFGSLPFVTDQTIQVPT